MPSEVGEATTEYHEQAVVAMIEHHFAPLLVGQDPTRITRAWQQMQRCFWWRGGVVASSAASGIEQALWDISGKACDQPVHRLLGGAVRDSVRSRALATSVQYGDDLDSLGSVVKATWLLTTTWIVPPTV